MSFLIRPSRRFPVCCPVTYQCGIFEGHGTVWNLSLTGWRFSRHSAVTDRGTVFAHGEPADLRDSLRGRWDCPMGARRGKVWGRKLVIDDESREDMEQYICQQVENKWIAFRARRTARQRNQEVDRGC